MCLKKSSLSFFLFFIIFFNTSISAKENFDDKVVEYIKSLKFFSCSFIQNDNDLISEGKIFIGSNRVRVEYNTPSKILIVLDKDKAMYYNYELDEDEFFDPSKTSASLFYEVFVNPESFRNSNKVSKDNYLIYEKISFYEELEIKIKIYFENNPLILRKIELFMDGAVLNLSIFNHKYNEEFDKNFFKLINPNFFN